MKKITVWVAMLLFASFAMGQVMPVQKNMMALLSKKEASATCIGKLPQKATKADATVWACDFEEGSPEYVLRHSPDADVQRDWVVGGLSEFFNSSFYDPADEGFYLIPVTNIEEKFGESASNTPTTWAFIDILKETLERRNFNYKLDSWIQFDNIDCSTLQQPLLSFNQVWRKLNQTYSYVEVSIDGGNNWIRHEVNEGAESQEYYYGHYELLLNEAAHQNNVSIRFRVETVPGNNQGQNLGYGWEIDDLTVGPARHKDLKLVHERMNFFGYYDYVTDPKPFGADANHGYNMHNYYANVPHRFYPEGENDGLPHIFNVCVKNIGLENQTPLVKVKVYDPNNAEIYSAEKQGISLAASESDTIDFIEYDAEGNLTEAAMNLLFILNNTASIGTYKVVYEIELDGDELYENNIDSCFFNVTRNMYSRDLNEPNNTYSMNDYTAPLVDGYTFGHEFLFFKNSTIESVDIFLAYPQREPNYTPTGAQIQCVVKYFDTEASQWEELNSSNTITIAEEHLGSWIHFTFEDPIDVMIPEDGTSTSVFAGIRTVAYNGGEVRIGYDRYKYTELLNWSFLSFDPSSDATLPSIGELRGGLSLHVNLENDGDEYIIYANNGSGGTIEPSGEVAVSSNGNQDFTITANEGHKIARILVDHENEVAEAVLQTEYTYTFNNVNENHNIRAEFVANKYTINASTGPNGSITPTGEVEVIHGRNKFFRITPHSGYDIKSVMVDDSVDVTVEAKHNGGSYTFINVVANGHKIYADFELKKYPIIATINNESMGTISPSDTILVQHGSDTTYVIKANEGFEILNVLVDGEIVSLENDSLYTFRHVMREHRIHAEFAAEGSIHTITASVNDLNLGDIDPRGAARVEDGTDKEFTIKPNPSSTLTRVVVDDTLDVTQDLVPSGNSFKYTFVNVTEDHTIYAEFFDNVTLVKEDVIERISVYPNPADSYIKVANAAGKDIVVYNVLGSVVKTVSNATSDQQIDVSNLVGGIYFVKVDNQVVKINVSK